MGLSGEAEAQLAAGAGGLELLAGLHAGVGELTGELRAARAAAYQKRADEEVRIVKAPGAVLTVGADGTGIMGLGGPKTGYAWAVKRISVADAASVSATVAGTAYVFAGVAVGTANKALIATMTENLEWIITPLPNVAQFGGRFGNNQDDLPDFPVLYGEHVYVYVAGGTNGQNLKIAITYGLRKPLVGDYRPPVGLGDG